MKSKKNNTEAVETAHIKSFRGKLKDYASRLGEGIYQLETACDDRLEYFRQDVLEMVSAGVLVGGLVAHRLHQAVMRMRGLHKTCGTVAVDKKFERYAERVIERLKEGCLAETVEGIEKRQRRRMAFFDLVSEKKHHMIKKVEAHIDDVIEHFLENRKRWTVTAATVTGCFMMFCVTVNAGTVYNYYYHGTEIGTVKDTTDVEAAAEQVKEAVTEELNVDVDVNVEPYVDITYEKEFSFSAIVDSAEDVADKLVNSDALEGSGYAMSVNGQVVVLVDTEETASKIMQTVRENYCTVSEEDVSESDTTDTTSATAAVETTAAAKTANTDAGEAEADAADVIDETDEIDQTEAARSIVLADSISEKTGVVDAAEEGEDTDFTEVAPSEGIILDNVIIEDDVTVEPVTSKISDFMDYDEAIDLFVDENGESKIFNILTVETEVYDETVAYNTVYEDTDTMYEGEYEVKTEGVDGVMQVVAKVTKENGQETDREILQQTVTTPAVDEVILKGTQEKPSWAPTGHFIQPASGRLSSNFGSRWGRKHQGIDIAGSYGSDVVASDGGTVIYAGYNSSGYGNLVKIDHGNGYVTYYAHNSSLCVSVGDKVYQGQVIAKMGSTGRSTGNHCHFEIRMNGTPVNPVNYLN